MEIRLDVVFAYVMHVTSHGDESDGLQLAGLRSGYGYPLTRLPRRSKCGQR